MARQFKTRQVDLNVGTLETDIETFQSGLTITTFVNDGIVPVSSATGIYWIHYLDA